MDEEISIDWSCCESTIKHMIDKRLPGKANSGVACGSHQLLKEIGQAFLDAYREYTTGE